MTEVSSHSSRRWKRQSLPSPRAYPTGKAGGAALRRAHGIRDDVLRHVQGRGGEAGPPQEGELRYRNATAALVKIGRLRVIHRGGRGAGDPAQYAFADVRFGRLEHQGEEGGRV